MNNQVVRDLNEDVDNNITIENLGEFLNAQTPSKLYFWSKFQQK